MTENPLIHTNPFDQFFRDILREELPGILNTILDAKRQFHGMPAKTTKLAVSAGEAAELLSVSRTTVGRLTKRGLIHPVKATRKPVYAVVELQRFLDETTRPIEV